MVPADQRHSHSRSQNQSLHDHDHNQNPKLKTTVGRSSTGNKRTANASASTSASTRSSKRTAKNRLILHVPNASEPSPAGSNRAHPTVHDAFEKGDDAIDCWDEKLQQNQKSNQQPKRPRENYYSPPPPRPQAQARPEPRETPNGEPKPAPKPEPRPQSEPEKKAPPQAKLKPEPKTEPKASPKPQTKATPKPRPEANTNITIICGTLKQQIDRKLPELGTAKPRLTHRCPEHHHPRRLNI